MKLALLFILAAAAVIYFINRGRHQKLSEDPETSVAGTFVCDQCGEQHCDCREVNEEEETKDS